MIPPRGTPCVVSRCPDVLSAEVDGEVAIMSIPNGRYYALDAVASAIWRRIEQPIGVDCLAAALAGEYAGEPGAIEKDLRDTLDEWLAARLIQVTPA